MTKYQAQMKSQIKVVMTTRLFFFQKTPVKPWLGDLDETIKNPD